MPVERKIANIEYLPYGECFFERRDYWNTPYKFNAKELDAETGLYYYGARYYTPEVSIWLSVDPLADKYPSMSAFMYCAGNPVILIDPDGMEIDNIGDGIKNFFKGVGNLLRGRGWNANHKTRLVKREQPKHDYEVMNVVETTRREGDIERDAGGNRIEVDNTKPSHQFNINFTIPTPVFPIDNLQTSTFQLSAGSPYYDYSFSQKMWKDNDGINIQASAIIKIQNFKEKYYHNWYNNGNRPEGKDPSPIHWIYEAKSVPIPYKVPKGIFGIKRWNKRTPASGESLTSPKIKYISN